MWRDAFGREAEIRSFREGDIVGIHELILRSDTESIIIRHEVSDRDVFAQGALFLVDFITRNRRDIRSGLYSMQELMDLYKHLH
jgi:4-hydroxy-tetrahydrodipicolinate reductase